MQKYTITVTADDLTKASTRFHAGSQESRRVKLCIADALTNAANASSVDCARVDQVLTFTSWNKEKVEDVLRDLRECEIPYQIQINDGTVLRVSVMALLGSGWILRAPSHNTSLFIRRKVFEVAADGSSTPRLWTLMFHNDGKNLIAEFDGIDVDDEGTNAACASELKTLFGVFGTSYEAL